MGFSWALHWWDDWQLRIFVLVSLFLQYFMFLAAASRKYQVRAWSKSLTWLAYLASDAAAIYALAALFIRHRRQDWISTHRSNASLEVLWAPILLLHLGGQDAITAYNIEDNELWMRHLLTALSQIAVALYVFWKSWPEDKRLLQATILLFVPGILKCFEKPWALKSASINSLVKKTSDSDKNGQKTSNSDKNGQKTSDSDKNGQINSLGNYVQAAMKKVQSKESSALGMEQRPYNLFVDLQYPYDVRLKNLGYMVHCEPDDAHKLVKSGLSKTFDRLYTKEQMLQFKFLYRVNPFYTKDRSHKTEESLVRAMCGALLREVVTFLTFAAIGLFHKSDRKAYDGTDVKITYILLSCTAVLELLQSAFPAEGGSDLQWPEQIAQYNLLGYLAHNRRHSWFRKVVGMLQCKGYLDQVCSIEHVISSSDITKLVHLHVLDWWKNRIYDAASYQAFNDNRGQQTLKREGRKDVEWGSLRRPFDESVLLWHIATDFCFYHMEASAENGIIHHCRVMSNYMVYLLYVKPEMLMPGARSSLFRAAYNELKSMFKDSGSIPFDKKEFISKIINKMKGTKGSGFIWDAWELAEALIGSGSDEEKNKMWEVIRGVWVEMLCFSAIRCRGYLHAKSLGEGGEYLSYVWLLLQYMGMESLAERLQRTELEDNEYKVVAIE